MQFDATPLPGYPLEHGLLLSALNDGTREWRGELGEPTEDALVWQARPGGHSIGGLLLHMAVVERLWTEVWCLNRPLTAEERETYQANESDVDNGVWPTPPRKPFEWYWELLMDARGRVHRAVKEFPAPEAEFTTPWGGTVTTRWTLAHLVQHDSYHGGQAVLLHDLFKSMQGTQD